jgi:hypothetical protein
MKPLLRAPLLAWDQRIDWSPLPWQTVAAPTPPVSRTYSIAPPTNPLVRCLAANRWPLRTLGPARLVA